MCGGLRDWLGWCLVVVLCVVWGWWVLWVVGWGFVDLDLWVGFESGLVLCCFGWVLGFGFCVWLFVLAVWVVCFLGHS